MNVKRFFGQIKPYFTGNARTLRFHVGSGLSPSCHVLDITEHVFFDSLREVRRKGGFSICYFCYRELERVGK